VPVRGCGAAKDKEELTNHSHNDKTSGRRARIHGDVG
jgi:hypothetical protein